MISSIRLAASLLLLLVVALLLVVVVGDVAVVLGRCNGVGVGRFPPK